MVLGRVMTDMYADEDAGLMIDAPDSGDEENPNLSSHEKSLKSSEKTNGNTESPKTSKKELHKQSPPGTNGSGSLGLISNSGPSPGQRTKKSELFTSVDDGLEDGEIPNELVVKNFLEPVSQPPAKRRKVTEMVDASTCVTEADDTDEIPNMKQSQYYKLNVLILSRNATSSGHTFTFTTTIRGQTYHGVLTDGSPPVIHNNQIQKRAMAAEKEKAEDSESSEKRDATPKPRGPKRSRGEDEKSPMKIKPHRHRSPNLKEVTSDPYMRCPHKQCGFRFLAVNDLNNHLFLNHVSGGVILKEEAATQTTDAILEKCKTCEQKLREEMSINELFGGIKGDKNIKKEEDDEVAPKLEKEETTKERPLSSPNLEAVARDARLPTMPSITQRPEVKIEPSVNSGLPVLPGSSGNVNPFLWNSGSPFAPGFPNPALAVAAHKVPIPGFPSLGTPVNNGLSPIPSSSKLQENSGNRHKLHELKTDTSTSSSGVPTTATASGASIQGRSITAGTSGNPMDLLLRPQVPRALSAAPSPATGPLAAPFNIFQQHMLRGLFANPNDLNQFKKKSDNFGSSDFSEDCMYENYVRIFKDSNCPKSIFALPSNDSRIPVPVGYSSCSLELFKKVQQICNYQNRETAIYLTDSSPVGSYTEDYFVNQWTHQGNVIIMSKAIQKRSTTYSIKGENWKLASDIGGTFALYVGFTFMSVVETVAFFVSKKLRKLIADDDQTLMERKNPPIKFPCLSQRILDRVSFVRKLQEKIKSKAKQDM